MSRPTESYLRLRDEDNKDLKSRKDTADVNQLCTLLDKTDFIL